MPEAPVIYWVRRDFRLSDNPALVAAAAGGAPVIPVVIYDETLADLGAAPAWRWGLAVAAFAKRLTEAGSRVILRRGPALEVLRALVAETGAQAVHWGRLYDREARARDTAVKAALTADGIAAVSHAGHLLNEPWTVETGSGGFYRVYSPYWRAVAPRPVDAPLPVPRLTAPETWPASDELAAWALDRRMDRGAAVLRPRLEVGEAAAQAQLQRFLAAKIAGYKAARDRLDQDATSGLSAALSYGEISPRQCWQGGQAAMEAGAAGAEHFLKELVWREFAAHLLFYSPEMDRENWREGWDAFPWQEDPADPGFLAWCQGRTGVPVIDAAMRELYVTGRMHNRARMLVASYLTKHMLMHWRLGLAWFAACLVDWDPASNAMGWQWVAGSGPDAAPYFRIFNPETQAEKFDPEGRYRRRWVAELSARPGADALAFFDAAPRSWSISPDDPYPSRPIVPLAEGRARALAAYENRRA